MEDAYQESTKTLNLSINKGNVDCKGSIWKEAMLLATNKKLQINTLLLCKK